MVKILRVTPNYVAHVGRLLDARPGQSQEQLQDALLRNQAQGARAEEAIVAFEQSRLEFLGRNAEASLVRRISQLRADAGYDIESFDGDMPLFDYDRFIEVKSSQKAELRFYWTVNEIDKARKFGDRYWIYFLGNFKNHQAQSTTPLMIRNPAQLLFSDSEIHTSTSESVSITPTVYLVERVGELFFQEVKYGNITALEMGSLGSS